MPNHAKDSWQVVIAEPSELLRRGIRDVLGRDPRFNVVAEVLDPREAIMMYETLAPDLLFLSLRLDTSTDTPPLVQQMERTVHADPGARIIALLDRADLRDVMRVIGAGARGVLLHDAPAQTLVEAAHDVVAGGVALEPRLAFALFEEIAAGWTVPDGAARGFSSSSGLIGLLSPREREVLAALANGYRNKEIAAQLGVSVGTVKTHLRHIFRKLEVGDRTSAVLYALRSTPSGVGS